MSTERPPGEDGPDGEEEAVGADGRHEGVDVDAAWAQILAHWDDPAPARSPARQPGSAAGGRDAGPGRVAPPGRPAPGDDRPGRHRLDGTGPAGDGPAAPPAEQRRRRTDPRPEPTRPPAAPPSPAPRYEARGTDADPLAEEHWTPPEPPPLPRSGWRGWLPWVGVLGVPFFFVVVVITKPSLPPVVMLVAVLGFVAGFVTLVMRLPSHRDDDGDDGARV